MIQAAAMAAALLFPVLITAQTVKEPRSFFREQIGLSDDQVGMIVHGKPVAKVLPSKKASELFVFGAVFINSSPEAYAKLAFDMSRLRKSPNYLGVGQFSEPPSLADMGGFTLEPDDIARLRHCKPGDCKVQLPAEMMRELQSSVDWSKSNIAEQVNDRVRKMGLKMLQQYRKDGNRVLGVYQDSDDPFDVNAQLRMLLGRAEAMPVNLPELNHYLLEYPNASLPNVETLFFWERVNFGLKPTLRLNHATAYRSEGPRGAAQVVAVKQLYASHYLQLALDLTVCVPEGKGFYLITMKGSTQQGLTGFTGSILRRIIVSRTRSAQERMLLNIKQSLEGKKY